MSELMLGDNPFFAISHLSPSKSVEYLADEQRWSKAKQIIQESQKLGINSFMISSHQESRELLDSVGYLTETDLPDICLVVPNVHKVNSSAASNGVVGSLKELLKGGSFFSNLNPVRIYQRIVMSNLNYRKIRHVALHNVVVDMLVGLRARMVLRAFCFFTRFCGYKPVLITLNPLKLFKMGVKCDAICCYYNKRGYNVCDDPQEVLEYFEAQRDVNELWAMGVVASGVVSYDELKNDALLRRFSRVLIASSRLERIKEMSELFSDEKIHSI